MQLQWIETEAFKLQKNNANAPESIIKVVILTCEQYAKSSEAYENFMWET